MTNYDPVHDTTVTVYTKPDCQPCRLTKQYLQRNNIPFHEFDVTESDQALTVVQGLGYQSVPVVVSGFDHWSGLRPDKLANIPR